MTQMHPQSHIPQENPQQERDGETGKTLPAYIRQGQHLPPSEQQGSAWYQPAPQAGQGRQSAPAAAPQAQYSQYSGQSAAPQADESQTPSAGYVPQTGQRTFAAGYTAVQPQQAPQPQAQEHHGMQAQSAPSPYQAPPSPYQTASAPAVGAAFQPAPQAARGLTPPFAQKPDKNRLPRDFGFFHFTDAVNYLREIAGYQWWRPLFTLLIVLGWIGVFELAAVLTLRNIIRELVYGGAIRYLAAMEGSVPLWLYILINFGVTAVIFLPPTLIGTVMADGRPVSTLTSRYGKMRWKTLAWCTGVAFFWAFLIILLPKIIAGPDFLISRLDSSGFLVNFIVVITVIPVQCAAEEYLFRGVVLQAFGRWIPPRYVLTAPVIPAVIFASLHTQYGFWGKFVVFIMGLCTGYLVLFTGGLEAGIAIHTANNCTIGLALILGLTNRSGSGALSEPVSITLDILMEVLFFVTVLALGHRFKWFAGTPVPPHAMRNFRKPVRPAFIGGQVPYTAQQTLWQGQQSGMQPQPAYAYPSAPFAPFAANAPAQYGYPDASQNQRAGVPAGTGGTAGPSSAPYQPYQPQQPSPLPAPRPYYPQQ